MNRTRRMSQRRKRKSGTTLWKTITIPNLRFNSEKIKKFYALEYKHEDILNQQKGNVANYVTLPSIRSNISVIRKEVYMPFITRHSQTFLDANKQYDQGIKSIGGTVINDKDLKKLINKKK